MSDEALLEFLDTNVLLYAHDVTAGTKRERAMALVTGLWESSNGCLSVQVFQEFYVNITRKVKKPLDSSAAYQIIADLSHWRVHVPNTTDVLEAIRIQQRNQISFWDAMIVASAAQLGCGVIWSEDLNPGQVYEGIRVLNPFQPVSA